MSSNMRKSRLLLWLVIIAVLAIGISACGGEDSGGGDTGSSSGSQAPDGCTLISQADVDAAMGAETTAIGSVAEDGAFSTCTWRDNTGGGSVTLSIWGNNSSESDWAESYVNSQVGNIGAEPTSGLGDGGYVIVEGESARVYWHKGNAFAVVLTGNGLTMSESDFLDLAKTIDGAF